MSLGNALGLKVSYTGKWLDLTYVFYKENNLNVYTFRDF